MCKIDSYPLGRCAVALVLDGRTLAKQIEADLLQRVEALKTKQVVRQFWQLSW